MPDQCMEKARADLIPSSAWPEVKCSSPYLLVHQPHLLQLLLHPGGEPINTVHGWYLWIQTGQVEEGEESRAVV